MDVTPVGNQTQALPVVPDTASPKWLVENREIIRSVQSIDAAELFGDGHELTFTLDQATKRPVVRVVNRQTHEVLWQAPPEYVLRVAAVLGRQDGFAESTHPPADAFTGYGS